jgi:tetratricopeptide (TPR) repeat protein
MPESSTQPNQKKLEQAFNQAQQAEAAGNFPEAEILYRKIYQAAPNLYPAANNLGLLAYKFQHYPEAVDFFTRVIQIAPTYPDGHSNHAAALARTGEHQQALDHYKTTLQLQADHPRALAGIKTCEQKLRISQDPDYNATKQVPWDEDASIWEECEAKRRLIVVFSGLGVGTQKPTFIFYNFLKHYQDVDKIFLRDINRHWYFGGLPGTTDSVQGTVELLREKISGYEQVVFLGSSAGAMAAILYGELLEVDKVIAFAPQTVLSPLKEQQLGDQRWLGFLQQFRTTVTTPEYLDLTNLAPIKTSIDIHYAAGDKLDQSHAERLNGEYLQHFAHDCDGHFVALHLRDNGQLGDILDNALYNR